MSLLRYVPRPSPSMVVALMALLVASAGVAYAAIPDGAGVIHGCYANRTGTLRVIDTGATPPGTCNAKETALSWNEQGIPGTSGSVGSTYVRINFGFVACDAGDFATGGGALSPYGVAVDSLVPLTDGVNSTSGQTPNGFSASGELINNFPQVWVICVDATP